MAIVSGSTSPTRGVGLDQTLDYGGTTTILTREVGSKIFYLDPSAAPFTLLTDRAGSKPATNPKFEWYEKSLRPKADTVGTGTADTTTTDSMEPSNPTYFQVNDIVLNATSGEVFRVAVGATSGTLGIVRSTITSGYGAAANIVAGDDLFIIGSAHAEGADVGVPDEWQEVQKFNWTQIFRTPFGATRTREASETFFGQTRPKLRAEKAIEHAMEIEKAMLFGQNILTAQAEETATNGYTRTTKGFAAWATSNVLDLNGASLSEPDLEGLLEDVFAHTSAGDSRTLFCGAAVITVLDMLALDKLKTVPTDKTYGITVRQWLTSHGTLNVVKHRLMADGSGGDGYGDSAFIVDPSKLKLRPLTGGTTSLKVDRQGPGVDGWVDEYLTEVGLEFANAEVHGSLIDVGAAA